MTAAQMTAVAALLIFTFFICTAMAASGWKLLDERIDKLEAEVKACNKDREIKTIEYEITDLKDRVWNDEIHLSDHKKDCTMTTVKLDVLELLEDRVAKLEAKLNNDRKRH